jgi:hypothetical protein
MNIDSQILLGIGFLVVAAVLAVIAYLRGDTNWIGKK